MSTTSQLPRTVPRAVSGGRTNAQHRRAQLTESALKTLAELGYARTSLREIAQNSPLSHGVVHYYFADKAELITACVTQYKSVCATRYDDVLAQALTAPEFVDGIVSTMSTTVDADRNYHRMWYDLRNQSLFDNELQADVAAIDKRLCDMVFRIISRYAELTGRTVLAPAELAYGAFDGVFQQALGQVFAGEHERGAAHLSAAIPALLDTCVPQR